MMYKVYSPLYIILKYYAISRVDYFSVLYIQKLGCSKNYELNSWRYVSKENTKQTSREVSTSKEIFDDCRTVTCADSEMFGDKNSSIVSVNL